MAKMRVCVLQPPKLFLDGVLLTFPYKKAEALLYYMAVEKQSTRDRLSAILWENCDETTAKKNLRHALYTIRKIFREDCIISPDRQNLMLNPELEWECDYDEFLEKKKLDLYETEFLNGFYLKNSELYEEWLTFKREEVRDVYLRLLEERLEDTSSLRVSEAEQLFEKYIREDSLEEQAYYYMMKVYGEHKLYYRGIRLYQQLAALLKEELRVAPRKEIRDMHQSFLQQWSMASEEEKTGHEKEAQSLVESYRMFLSGMSRNVLLTGESGVGKTYLIQQLLERVSREKTMIFQAVCLETEQRMNLQPWNVIMLQMADAVKEGEFQAREQELQAAAHLFPYFQSEKETEGFLADTTISYSYRATRNLLLHFFHHASQQKPILLVFDNIQYMDSMSLEFLSVLIRRKEKHIMVFLTCPNCFHDRLRPVLPALIKEKYLERIFVSPFSREEVKRITERSLGKEAAKPEFVDQIYEESKGNAYFLEMLLGEYARGNLKAGEPSRIEELLREQLEALPKATRQVLELLSACQAWGDMDSLVHILHRDPLELLDAVEELKEKGFLYETQVDGQERFLFCRGSMQKFVHEQMAPSKRRVFHQRLAEYIEGLPTYEYVRWERLIYHYGISGNQKKALEYQILSMAEYARKFYELYPVFCSSCTREAFLEDSLVKQCGELERELLKLYQKEQAGKESAALYSLLLLTKAQYCIPQGYYEEGCRCAQKALKMNEEAGNDPLIRIRGLRLLIHQQMNVWELEKTGEYLEESLKAAEEGKLEEDYAVTCRLNGLYLSMIGEFEKSMESLTRALAYFERAPLKSRIYALNISACYNYMGEAMRKQKYFQEALEFYEKAVRVCENNQCPCNAVVYSNMGRTWLAMGEEEKSESAFYKAQEIYDESFTLIGRSMTKGYLSLIEAKAGRRKQARKLLWEAEESAKQLASPYAKGILYLHKAELKVRFPQMFGDILKQSVGEYEEKAKKYLEKIPGGYEREGLNL